MTIISPAFGGRNQSIHGFARQDCAGGHHQLEWRPCHPEN